MPSDARTAISGGLLRGLDQRGLTDRVNIVVVSDHGMAAVSTDRVIVLDDYISLDDVVISDINPTVGLFPKPGKEDAVYEALVKAHPRLRVFRRSETPEAWHYRDHPRIPPIIGVVDEGWQIMRRATRDGDSRGAHQPRRRPARLRSGADVDARRVRRGGAGVPAGRRPCRRSRTSTSTTRSRRSLA